MRVQITLKTGEMALADKWEDVVFDIWVSKDQDQFDHVGTGKI